MFHRQTMIAWLLGLGLAAGSVLAQEPQFEPFMFKGMRTGVGFDYFSRTVLANERDSRVQSYFFTLDSEFEWQGGLKVGLILGFASSSFDEMTFRRLPVSIELNVGFISGFLIGPEIRQRIISLSDFELSADAQFLVFLGKRSRWDIPGLAVDGTVDGRPNWMRLRAGGILTLQKWINFFPYVAVRYDNFWGKFKLEQEIERLTGTEDKEFSGRVDLSATLGTTYIIIPKLSVTAEATYYPDKSWKGSGFAVAVRLLFGL